MTKDELEAVCKRAGVTKDEMTEDPEHGLMLSASGVQKLRRLAAPGYMNTLLGQQAADAMRQKFRRVK